MIQKISFYGVDGEAGIATRFQLSILSLQPNEKRLLAKAIIFSKKTDCVVNLDST